MKQYIQLIRNTIEAHAADFTAAGVLPPQTIDVYMGQPNNPEDFEFTLPAVFIDYSADYDGEVLDLQLHVVQDFLDDTENFAPQRDNGLRFVTFLSVLKKCLYGLKYGVPKELRSHGVSVRPVFGVLKLYQETPMQTDFFHYHLLTLRCSLNSDLYAEMELYTDVEPVSAVLENGRLKRTMG